MLKRTPAQDSPEMEILIQLLFRNAAVSKSGMVLADTWVLKAIATRMGYDVKKLKMQDITQDSVNPYARGRWYGNVEQELNRKAAVMLAEGKISKSKHDKIVAENRRQKAK